MISVLTTQDTIRQVVVVRIKTDNLLPDSVFRRLDEKPAFLKNADSGRVRRPVTADIGNQVSDTTSVCARNSIADITFYDSLNFVSRLKHPYTAGSLPFRLYEENRSASAIRNKAITTNLKDGILLPDKPLQNDWIITFILLVSMLYILVRSTTRSIWPDIARFFRLRGINESYSRDPGLLFSWQNAIMNMVTFIILGLFIFCAALWYQAVPESVPPLLFILLASGILILAVGLRHIVCVAAGNLSGESDLFNEYLISVYQSYRFSSIVISLLLVVLVYTTIIPPQTCIIAGVSVLGIFYFFRIIRLFLIFIKKDISILYLILYLCALEILPVLILLKYFESQI